MNFKKFSQLGQAFMLPISILPVAGLLLELEALYQIVML